MNRDTMTQPPELAHFESNHSESHRRDVCSLRVSFEPLTRRFKQLTDSVESLWDAASGMLNTSIFFLPLSYLLVPLTLVFTYRWIYRTSVTTERAWAKAVLAPEVRRRVNGVGGRTRMT